MKKWWTRPTPLPSNIHQFEHFDEVDLNKYPALLWITRREIDETTWTNLEERLVVYRPPEGQEA